MERTVQGVRLALGNEILKEGFLSARPSLYNNTQQYIILVHVIISTCNYYILSAVLTFLNHSTCIHVYIIIFFTPLADKMIHHSARIVIQIAQTKIMYAQFFIKH